MICPDCAAAADWSDGQIVLDVSRNYVEAARIETGHDRCFERNLGRPSQDCTCQHRVGSSEVDHG